MNFLILGSGSDEQKWASAVAASETHRLVLAYPALPGFPDVRSAQDLDEALAASGLDAVIVGGAPEDRAEALRRVAASGLPAIGLHPPGPDSEAYYQVSMSRAETGAVIVPDLPDRLHPGVLAIRDVLARDDLGAFRLLRYEANADPATGDLTRHAFARAVDLVRSLLGEIEAVNATGDPPGDRPDLSLVVHLRTSLGHRAEIRLSAGPSEVTRLVLTGEAGSLTLEIPDDPLQSSRLTKRSVDAAESTLVYEDWQPHASLLTVLEDAITGRAVHPDLLDGTRAMEVSEGVARSLRRARTIDLHYEEISEAGSFKSVMTSFGCLLLLSILVVVPIALAGPVLGMRWTIYFAYPIPPFLVVFVCLQMFRFALREPRNVGKDRPAIDKDLI